MTLAPATLKPPRSRVVETPSGFYVAHVDAWQGEPRDDFMAAVADVRRRLSNPSQKDPTP